MSQGPQSAASGRGGVVLSAPVLYQRTQANVVITLFVVGLLLALTTLVLNFTSPHVNAIITVGSFSALSFVAALITWVTMSKKPLPPPIEEANAAPDPAVVSQEGDGYARYIINQAIPRLKIPKQNAPTADFLITREGIGCLSLAVLNGDSSNVDKICRRFMERCLGQIRENYESSNIPTHGMPVVSQMLDQIDGLTPLHLVGHYLMTRWDKEASYGVPGTDYKKNLEMCALGMIHELKGMWVKDLSKEDQNVRLKHIKDRDGRTAKEYFERVLTPKVPPDLKDVLSRLCVNLSRRD